MPISTSASSAALADSFAERRHFTEASAAVYPEGGLVHVEDLVVRDTGMDVRTATYETSRAIAVLRARCLAQRRDGQGLLTLVGIDGLRGGRSSVAEPRVDRPEAVYEFDWAEDERLKEWQATVKQTRICRR